MTNAELVSRSQKLMPGGVNSPVRAFKSVGRDPFYVKKADGAYLYDVEDNKYLDYVMSWGPMILGHNNKKVSEAVVKAAANGLSFGACAEAEVLMAEQITELNGIDMVRMVNSGTEAVMSAVRLARGFTGRNKLIKFDGCYHGHSDSMLVKAGSGVLTAGVSGSAGVTDAAAADTLIAEYNDIGSVKTLFDHNRGEIAGVIIEPVCANSGVITPKEGFLTDLRRLCTENGVLLIFDEVITGFRLGISGAQGYYGVKADLVTYGKIIGGGMPVGAYGGRRELMERIAPLGDVYQAGTLSGNPVAMAAGLAAISELKDGKVYARINFLGNELMTGMKRIVEKTGIDARVDGVGSLCCLFVGRERYTKLFSIMLDQGVYLAPSQFEAMFVSAAHDDAHIEETLRKMEAALKIL